MVSAVEEQIQEIRRPSVKPQQCQLVSLTLRSRTARQTLDTFRVSCIARTSVDTSPRFALLVPGFWHQRLGVIVSHR